MTTYNIETTFDVKTRVLSATRGQRTVAKKMPGIVIPRDHGIAAADLLGDLGVRVPVRLILNTDQTETKPKGSGFKFKVGIEKP